MIRAAILAMIALALHAAVSAGAVMFGWAGLPVVPAVVIVAYVALAEPPIEAAVSAALLGLILDAVTAAQLGTNMLACMLALGVGRLFVPLVSAARGLPAFSFGAALSLGYHLVLLVLLSVFGGHREALQLFDIALTAVCDGLLATVLLPILSFMMVRLDLEERESSLSERLARRANVARRKRGRSS